MHFRLDLAAHISIHALREESDIPSMVFSGKR